MALPNRIDIIERVDRENPGLIVRDPHAFTALACAALHAEDARFGLNGKRGNPDDTSEDACAYLDDESPLVGSDGRRIWIVDFIAGANSSGARPAWMDQTRATISHGTTGVWVQPRAVAPTPGPVEPPRPPSQPPPPAPPAPVDLGPVLAALSELRRAIEDVAGKQQHLIDNLFQSGGDSPSMLEHMDDVKNIVLTGGRGERFR